jgi:hypothetical protein
MAAPASRRRRTPWWHAYATALAILVAVDLAVRAWVPHPLRLPEQFSANYLERYVASLRAVPAPVIVMGDSSLWGYKTPAGDSAPAVLARMLPRANIVNVSYEGGSPVNSEVLLEYLLQAGVRPRLVVFNVNQKEFNPADSAFRRLRPSLQVAAEQELTARDHAELDLPNRSSLNDRLNDLVARIWALYGYRTDLREALFGTDDLATLLTHVAGALSGYTSRQAQAEAPTAERFLGTYDLTPLDASNISYQRLIALASLLARAHLRAVAVLTPTNHTLLHDYIDNSVYAANVATAARMLRSHGVTTLNLDAAIPAAEFIDNDHLTSEGNRHFAELLRPTIEEALR